MWGSPLYPAQCEGERCHCLPPASLLSPSHHHPRCSPQDQPGPPRIRDGPSGTIAPLHNHRPQWEAQVCSSHTRAEGSIKGHQLQAMGPWLLGATLVPSAEVAFRKWETPCSTNAPPCHPAGRGMCRHSVDVSGKPTVAEK